MVYYMYVRRCVVPDGRLRGRHGWFGVAFLGKVGTASGDLARDVQKKQTVSELRIEISDPACGMFVDRMYIRSML